MRTYYINLLEPPVAELWQICPMILSQQNRRCATRNTVYPDLVRGVSSATIKMVKIQICKNSPDVGQVLSLSFVLKQSKLPLLTRTAHRCLHPVTVPGTSWPRRKPSVEAESHFTKGVIQLRRRYDPPTLQKTDVFIGCKLTIAGIAAGHWMKEPSIRVDLNRLNILYLQRYFCISHLHKENKDSGGGGGSHLFQLLNWAEWTSGTKLQTGLNLSPSLMSQTLRSDY